MTLQTELTRAFLAEHPREAARALERMEAQERAEVVRVAPEAAAGALAVMVPAAAAECLMALRAAEVGPVLQPLEPYVTITILRRMPLETAARLISELAERKREALRRMLRYPEGTAGAVMDPLALALPDDITVSEARVRLRREPQSILYYLYVIDRGGALLGVLDIPELMRGRARDSIASVMNKPVEQVPAWTPASAIRAHPGWRSFHALPVTDEAGRFVGAIRYQTLRRLEQEAGEGGAALPSGLTVGALGELFHLGLAGFVEGVAGAATRRNAESGGGR